jgi:hypothetical protein
MSWTPPDFEVNKAKFLRIARTAEKASSKGEFRALLMADLEAPYHAFNPFDLSGNLEQIGTEMAFCILDDLDEDGVPK